MVGFLQSLTFVLGHIHPTSKPMYRKTIDVLPNMGNRRADCSSVEQNRHERHGGRRGCKKKGTVSAREPSYQAGLTCVETRKCWLKKELGEESHILATFEKTHIGLHRYDMALFLNWMNSRDNATLLRLRSAEHAEFFNPGDYNAVFDGQLEKLIHRLPDSEARQQAMAMRDFDWANYIVRSLQRGGVRDDDSVQEHFHAIVVKLLVEPGKLFKWEPQKHGPLEKRYPAATWEFNSQHCREGQKPATVVTTADPSIMAGQFPGRAPYSDLIDQFRSLIAQRLGALAAAILDQKLAGEDANKMVGKAEFGTPSAYYIKAETEPSNNLPINLPPNLEILGSCFWWIGV